MHINNLTVVICCNKKDVFLARICIASIRYYYPEIDIELVKDPGNGSFSTSDLEKYFKVKVVDLGIPKMGWSGAKFHYLYQQDKGKKVLILDADIVFIGPFLERLMPAIAANDYVVSIQENGLSDKVWVRNTYFDIDEIRKAYPTYVYPGYFFNAGQIFLTIGSIDENVLDEYFNVNEFPFWRNQQLFPLVDQSVYNYLLPTLSAEHKLKLGKEKFMVWAASNDLVNISLKEVMDRNLNSGLIHWAGCVRIPYVRKMLRGDILAFFENTYYDNIPLGYIKKYKNRIFGYLVFSFTNIYRQTFKRAIQVFKK